MPIPGDGVPRCTLLLGLCGAAHAFSYGGHVDGAVFPTSVPRAAASSLLPAGLELAPLPPCNSVGSESCKGTAATHPLLLIFTLMLRIGAPFTHFTYDELIVVVPYVQWDDDHAPAYAYRGPFTYLPLLYLNESLPVQLGRWWAGDNKELATINRSFVSPPASAAAPGGGAFSVSGAHRLARERIVAATWADAALGFANASAFPVFARDIAPGFNLPSIGRYPPDSNASAPWRCLPQDWHTSEAKLLPIEGTVTIDQPFVAGALPVGSMDFPPLRAGAAGGFRMRTAWQYTSLSSDCTKTRPNPTAEAVENRPRFQRDSDAI